MLSQSVIALLPFLAAVGAAPRGDVTTSTTPIPPPPTTTTTGLPSFTPVGAEYYLQAQPLDENPSDVVNNYVSTFHSGAGTNNVTLVAQSEASKASLDPDGGYQEFDLGTTYPWGLTMTEGAFGGETAIKGASFVSINVGYGDAGFSIPNATVGLTWNNTAFGGWLACNITKQTTGLQLFWANKTEERKEKAPKDCQSVRLAPKYF